MPSRADVEAAAERLRHHGHEVADDGRTLRVSDPWGSAVALTPAA